MNPVIAAIIVQVVTELLKNCPEERAERVTAMFHNPGPLLKIKLEGAIRRRLNISPREWRDKSEPLMAPVYNEGKAATVEDVQELMEMSKVA